MKRGTKQRKPQARRRRLEQLVRFLRAFFWFAWRIAPRIDFPSRNEIRLSWRMAHWREMMKAKKRENPHGYILDGYGQPTCENCGETTNAHYKQTPNLICWKCGGPVKSNTTVRLFVDDQREPEWFGLEGWVVARTSAEAIKILACENVVECSLDHDLGGADTGYIVACWMEKHGVWPKDGTRCHSANPVGKARIEAVIWANTALTLDAPSKTAGSEERT